MNKNFKQKINSIFNNIFESIDKNDKPNLRKTQKVTSIIAALLFTLVYYYIMLPPLNIRSTETWFFVAIIIAILVFLGGKSLKGYKIYRLILLIMLLAYLILQISGLTVLRSKSYANVIDITDGNFNEEIEELPVDKIPTLDRLSSIKLGSRKMGELLNLVSQFDIDETTYTQVNYQDHPVRVTPLMYNGFIKYIFNNSNGLPGYMKVDIVNGDADLVQLEEGIKYSKMDYFFRDILRYTRLKYPFEIFNDANFEIDEEGIPYWVIATYSPKVGFFNAQDVDGAILVNAITGEHIKYELNEIPQWIDRVYDADYIIQQLDWHGMYQGGYINSLFAQKNVLVTTEGYNYLALNDDVFLYTGYTSAAADQSNVGFILANLRTKETKFYTVSSAKEYSAMESAEGAVQEKGYDATFPLLLNIDGSPTYFLSLKDNAGLIKQYAFIDAENYQNVAIGNTVSQALSNHSGKSIGETPDEILDIDSSKILTSSGKIADIREVVIDGTSYFYIIFENSEDIFVAPITISNRLPFLQDERISFEYYDNNGVNEIIVIDTIQ